MTRKNSELTVFTNGKKRFVDEVHRLSTNKFIFTNSDVITYEKETGKKAIKEGKTTNDFFHWWSKIHSNKMSSV